MTRPDRSPTARRDAWFHQGLRLVQEAVGQAATAFDLAADPEKVLLRLQRVEVDAVRWSRRIPTPGTRVGDEIWSGTVVRLCTELRHAIASLPPRHGFQIPLGEAARLFHELIEASASPRDSQLRRDADTALARWRTQEPVRSLPNGVRQPLLNALAGLAAFKPHTPPPHTERSSSP